MVLNNVTKFHKILIKNYGLRRETMQNGEFSLTKGNKSLRHGSTWTIIKLEDTMVLNNVTKFH